MSLYYHRNVKSNSWSNLSEEFFIQYIIIFIGAFDEKNTKEEKSESEADFYIIFFCQSQILISKFGHFWKKGKKVEDQKQKYQNKGNIK